MAIFGGGNGTSCRHVAFFGFGNKRHINASHASSIFYMFWLKIRYALGKIFSRLKNVKWIFFV